eukprot:CAMPEP_0202846994 /NCGR_PEP_ID=MMETSP1389-20130828/74320_1 /ASSEMBLY_ACC=CAM_ASM_000865 /TAXON_ID=302021 /ORGANISM="Rhodomonas sp., Strain CCMP768" /LENGTH=75 /DNA_ID=CAMNT_0049524639 /DNA_START=556 /DNA_END=781 /DNA_ORIENTATION=-
MPLGLRKSRARLQPSVPVQTVRKDIDDASMTSRHSSHTSHLEEVASDLGQAIKHVCTARESGGVMIPSSVNGASQ